MLSLSDTDKPQWRHPALSPGHTHQVSFTSNPPSTVSVQLLMHAAVAHHITPGVLKIFQAAAQTLVLNEAKTSLVIGQSFREDCSFLGSSVIECREGKLLFLVFHYIYLKELL